MAAIGQLRDAVLAGRIGNRAGARHERDRDLRQIAPLDDEELEAVASFAVCTFGAQERPVGAERRLLRAIERGVRGPARRLGMEADEQPVARVRATDRRPRARSPTSTRAVARQVGLELAGIAEEHVVLVQQSALPPNPPMRSSPETNSNSCFVLARVELRRRRARPSPAARSRSVMTARSRRATSRAAPSPDDEHAGDLASPVERAHRRAQRLVVDERLVQPRRQPVGRESATRGRAPRRPARSIRARASRCRCAPAARDRCTSTTRSPSSARHPARGPIERRAGRDGRRSTSRRALGLRRIEVAGDDERQVVGRVVACRKKSFTSSSVAAVRSSMAADDRPRVRMARREACSRTASVIPAAVGLVLEPLPALVLDDVALVVELLLGRARRAASPGGRTRATAACSRLPDGTVAK